MMKLTLQRAREKERKLIKNLTNHMRTIENLSLGDDRFVIASVNFAKNEGSHDSFDFNNMETTLQLEVTLKSIDLFEGDDEKTIDKSDELDKKFAQALKDYKEYSDMLNKERQLKPSETEKASSLHNWYLNRITSHGEK